MAKRKTIYKLFALQAALMDKNLSKSDVLLLSILIEYENPLYGYAWPSVETLAKVAKLSRRAVQISLRRLEDAQFISTQTGGGRKLSSRYTVTIKEDGHSPLSENIKRAAEETANANSPFNAGNDEMETAKASSKRAHFCSETANANSPEPFLQNPSYKNPSANAASLESDACRQDEKDEGNIGAELAKFERACKEREIPFRDRPIWARWLVTVIGMLSEDEPNYHRAIRLYESLAELIPERD